MSRFFNIEIVFNYPPSCQDLPYDIFETSPKHLPLVLAAETHTYNNFWLVYLFVHYTPGS